MFDEDEAGWKGREDALSRLSSRGMSKWSAWARRGHSRTAYRRDVGAVSGSL